MAALQVPAHQWRPHSGRRPELKPRTRLLRHLQAAAQSSPGVQRPGRLLPGERGLRRPSILRPLIPVHFTSTVHHIHGPLNVNCVCHVSVMQPGICGTMLAESWEEHGAFPIQQCTRCRCTGRASVSRRWQLSFLATAAYLARAYPWPSCFRVFDSSVNFAGTDDELSEKDGDGLPLSSRFLLL